MYEDNLPPINFNISCDLRPQDSSINKYEEPFTILYNHRGSRNSKSRKGSIGKICETPIKAKKERKMTLPTGNYHEMQFSEPIKCETHSEHNFPTYNFIFQSRHQDFDESNIIDLEKGILYGIVQESELDKQSPFGLRNQNPEFELMD